MSTDSGPRPPAKMLCRESVRTWKNPMIYTDDFAIRRIKALAAIEGLDENVIDSDTKEKIREILSKPIYTDEDLVDAMQSKVWRLNFCYSIVDRNSNSVPFVMTTAQWKVYLARLRHGRIINLKSRQQGISTLWVVSFTDDCLYKPNVRSGMISIGLVQQQSLLKRVNNAWDMMEPWAKRILGVNKIRSNQSKNILFDNNSELMIAKTFRGDTLFNLHISEFGAIAQDVAAAKEIMEGSVQTVHEDGCVVMESTAEGENKFAELYRDGEAYLEFVKDKEDKTFPLSTFFPVFLSWVEDPKCTSIVETEYKRAAIDYRKELSEQGIIVTDEQMNFWSQKYRILSEGVFKEYPATVADAFKASTEGTIFAKHYLEFAHIDEEMGHPYQEYNWDPRLPVYVSFDLGVNDSSFMIWYQVIDKKLIILREKEFTDSGLTAFSRYMREYCSENKDRLSGNPGYKYEYLIFPRDGSKRQMDNEANRSIDLMKRKGWRIKTSKSKGYEDNRLIMEIMSQLYIFKENCPKLHNALLNYRKEYDNKRGVWTDKPRHDEHSHAIDSLRYGVKDLYTKLMRGDVIDAPDTTV